MMPGDVSDLFISSNTLRKVLAENPDLPLLVMRDTDCDNDPDYYLTTCSDLTVNVENVVQWDGWNEGMIYTDRESLESHVELVYLDESISEEEYNELVESKMKELDDKWVRCIVLTVYSG